MVSPLITKILSPNIVVFETSFIEILVPPFMVILSPTTIKSCNSFVGSTSVYDDDENYSIITETSPTSNSKTALQLLEVEALFTTNKNFDTTVLRFSGLFGGDRHPATFLSGKSNLKNGDAPVNLIHRDDCISIIVSILQQHLWNVVFNASTTTHPSKKAYYTSVCNTLGIPLPEFNNPAVSKGKIIDSKTLIQLLDYNFEIKIPTP